MAPITNVVVLTTHGRRMNVKIQQDTTIMKILEDVCKKYEFNVEEFDLKHHNKVLDLSIQMRYSGLPNNASLEMCAVSKKRLESSVVIMVQLENGDRVTGNFMPSDTVWHIISTLCGAQLGPMENPVVIYTRTELCGKEKMESTTLRSLGLLGGRAMFRLLNRTEEQLRTQANVSAPIPKQPRAPSPPPREKKIQAPEAPKLEVKPSPLPQLAEIQPQPSGSRSPKASLSDGTPSPPRKTRRRDDETPPMDLSEIDIEEAKKEEEIERELEKELHILDERNAVIFNRLINDPAVSSLDDLPNDFFELTLEDAKKIMRDLRRKREQLEDQPIKTTSMRELEENTHQLELLQKYRHTVIRINFPDGIVLQAAFKPTESGESIYRFVRSYLRQAEHSFELYTAPPKRILQPEDRLIEIGCVPAAMLHYTASVKESPFLRQDVLDKISSPGAALLAAKRSRTS